MLKNSLPRCFNSYNPRVSGLFWPRSHGGNYAGHPDGAVKQVQQIRVSFSADMVPMGDPHSKVDPLNLKCNVRSKKKSLDQAENQTRIEKTPAHKARWIDSKNWSIDFNRPLASGIHCEMKIAENAKDLAGKPVTGLNAYDFSTSGPALLAVSPTYGNIEPEQFFALQLDGEINPKSVEDKAYFESEKVPDKIGLRVVTGVERDVVLRAAIKQNWSWRDFQKYADLKKPLDSVAPFKNFLVVAGQRRFPEDAKLVLHWPRGILSKTGLSVDEEQSFDFKGDARV